MDFDPLADHARDALLYRPRRKCDDPLPPLPALACGQEPAQRCFQLLVQALLEARKDQPDDRSAEGVDGSNHAT